MADTTAQVAHGHDHPEPNYFVIMVWLTVLTGAELAVAILLTTSAGKALLVLLALAKALLVGLYFMHLRYEKRLLGLIAMTPLILCVYLMLMLLPDIAGVKHHTAKDLVATAPGGEAHGGH